MKQYASFERYLVNLHNKTTIVLHDKLVANAS
jgi:hypothetical protein